MKLDRTSLRSVQGASLLLIAVFALAAGHGMMVKPHAGSEDHGAVSAPTSSPQERSNMKRYIATEEVPANDVPVNDVPIKEVVVAIVDTGFDSRHLRLKSHLWKNVGEMGWDQEGRAKSSNGIDDDENGFIDDVDGFDFVTGQFPINDTHGHGTHIAGIVAQNAPQARLMNLKYFDRNIDGVTALKNSIDAIKYAVSMGADIINYSGGGTVPSREELEALHEASRKGILIVAAAGNEGANSERQPYFPANYQLTNILSVTAIDTDDKDSEMLPTSNFGRRSVAVAARGKDVMSTLPGNRFGVMTGTSQATAFATAVAANMIIESRQRRESISPEEIIERIVVSSRVTANLKGKTRLGSKLEARRALAFRKTVRNGTEERAKNQFLKAFEAELLSFDSQARVNPLSNR